MSDIAIASQNPASHGAPHEPAALREVLVFSSSAVAELLPMADCIAVIADAMVRQSLGGAEQPPRTRLQPSGVAGFLGWMPGYLDDPRSLGIKVVSVFAGSRPGGHASHQGAIMLFDPDDGTLKAIVDCAEVTALRTAAASAAATRALARADASTLAVLGTGEQAARHIEAMLAVRPLRRVIVWGRSEARAASFARTQEARFGMAIEVGATAQAAVAEADIICTTTSASEPILQGAWLNAGCHLNVVGSSFREAREIDDEAVVRARLFADARWMTEAQGGEYLHALGQGLIGPEHLLGEIGDVLAGTLTGRNSDDDITIYKSLGIAAQDLAAASAVASKAVLIPEPAGHVQRVWL